MGIARFYNGWVRRIPRAARVVLSSGLENFRLDKILEENGTRGVSWIYLDMNGIFHAAAQHIYAYGQRATDAARDEMRRRALENESRGEEELTNSLLEEITARIEGVVARTRPREGFVMCVDGVAPPAKMMQQRTRRFRGEIGANYKIPASHEATESDKFFSLSPPPVWDPNAITPGTPFMFALDAHIESWLERIRGRPDFPPLVYYSGHLIPGEGEHKIAHLVRPIAQDTPADDVVARAIGDSLARGAGAHVFYGLDADLFMITMINLFEGQRARHAYLMREETGDLVSLNALCEYLASFFAGNSAPDVYRFWRNRERQREYVVGSFVVSMFLMGNDFLPHFGFLHNNVDEEIAWICRTCARHEPLARTGRDPRTGEGNYLYRVNARALEGVMTDLARLEPERLSRRMKKEIDEHKPYAFPDALLLDSFGNSSIGTQAERFEDYARLQRQRATHLASPTPAQDSRVDACARDLAQAYIYTLSWVLGYYTLGHARVDADWFYPSAYTLTMRDVLTELTRQLHAGESDSCAALRAQSGARRWENSKFRQLLAVLPASSSRLIPKALHHLTLPNSPISDMFPARIAVDRAGTHLDYQAIVLAPPVDLERIEEQLDALARTGALSADVIKRFDGAREPVFYQKGRRDLNPHTQRPREDTSKISHTTRIGNDRAISAREISKSGSRGGAETPPASRGGAETPPASRGGAVNYPASRGGAANYPASRGGAANYPASRGGAANYPASRGGAATSPASRGGAANYPASRGGAATSPASRGGAATRSTAHAKSWRNMKIF